MRSIQKKTATDTGYEYRIDLLYLCYPFLLISGESYIRTKKLQEINRYMLSYLQDLYVRKVPIFFQFFHTLADNKVLAFN